LIFKLEPIVSSVIKGILYLCAIFEISITLVHLSKGLLGNSMIIAADLFFLSRIQFFEDHLR